MIREFYLGNTPVYLSYFGSFSYLAHQASTLGLLITLYASIYYTISLYLLLYSIKISK